MIYIVRETLSLTSCSGVVTKILPPDSTKIIGFNQANPSKVIKSSKDKFKKIAKDQKTQKVDTSKK